MNTRPIAYVLLIVLIVLGFAFFGIKSAKESPGSSEAMSGDAGETVTNLIASGPAFSAIREAAAEGKYSFLFFYKGNDEQTVKMRDVFDSAMERVEDRGEPVFVDADDPKSLPLINRYGADRAPLPLTLAVAPNGAVTRGLPRDFTEDQILEGFVSPCMEKCMGALQSQKLTLLCVHEPGSGEGEKAMEGVRDLQADPQYNRLIEVVRIDPNDSAEAGILKDLKVNPEPGGAVTVLLAPPGRVLATLAGSITKKDLMTAIGSGAAGPGCGPGASPGCCPPKTTTGS